MKQLLFLSFLVLIYSCGGPKKVETSGSSNKYLPEVLNGIDFKMTLPQVLKSRPGLQSLNEDLDFREVYFESIQHEKIESVIYYFDKDQPQPLYEVIVRYKEVRFREQAADYLFGQPNHRDQAGRVTEWMINYSDGYQIHAWPYGQKLIVVAKLPGTEWE